VLTIDGSQGEGGGQILRTALALSLVTGTPFTIEKIRAGRRKPGLLRQHLTAVNAAVAVGGSDVDGVTLGSQTLVFRPRAVKPGAYRFAIGTAGSTGLVIQTVLPALVTASGPSTLTLEGGTHNPAAPPFDFLARAFLPLVQRMGPRVAAVLDCPGFYPAGGGRCVVRITPSARLEPLTLLERGAIKQRRARALVAHLPRQIADRELAVVRSRLGWNEDELEAVVVDGDTPGPGNVLLLEVESEHLTEIFCGFGESASAPSRSPSKRPRKPGATSRRGCRSACTWPISCSCPSPWPARARSGPSVSRPTAARIWTSSGCSRRRASRRGAIATTSWLRSRAERRLHDQPARATEVGSGA
jgi:RNA 3'-terminal phosphate cyclase (ATP)